MVVVVVVLLLLVVLLVVLLLLMLLGHVPESSMASHTCGRTLQTAAGGCHIGRKSYHLGAPVVAAKAVVVRPRSAGEAVVVLPLGVEAMLKVVGRLLPVHLLVWVWV